MSWSENMFLLSEIETLIYEQTLVQAVNNNAIDWVFRNSENLGVTLCKTFGITSTALKSVKDLQGLVASSTAMTAVAASSTAMTAVAASSTAMTAVAASSAAMSRICNKAIALNICIKSNTARNALCNSSYLQNFKTDILAQLANTTYFTLTMIETAYTGGGNAWANSTEWSEIAMPPSACFGVYTKHYAAYNNTVYHLQNTSKLIATYPITTGSFLAANNDICIGGLYVFGASYGKIYSAK